MLNFSLDHLSSAGWPENLENLEVQCRCIFVGLDAGVQPAPPLEVDPAWAARNIQGLETRLQHAPWGRARSGAAAANGTIFGATHVPAGGGELVSRGALGIAEASRAEGAGAIVSACTAPCPLPWPACSTRRASAVPAAWSSWLCRSPSSAWSSVGLYRLPPPALRSRCVSAVPTAWSSQVLLAPVAALFPSEATLALGRTPSSQNVRRLRRLRAQALLADFGGLPPRPPSEYLRRRRLEFIETHSSTAGVPGPSVGRVPAVCERCREARPCTARAPPAVGAQQGPQGAAAWPSKCYALHEVLRPWARFQALVGADQVGAELAVSRGLDDEVEAFAGIRHVDGVATDAVHLYQATPIMAPRVTTSDDDPMADIAPAFCFLVGTVAKAALVGELAQGGSQCPEGQDTADRVFENSLLERATPEPADQEPPELPVGAAKGAGAEGPKACAPELVPSEVVLSRRCSPPPRERSGGRRARPPARGPGQRR
ncbi:unnamed protein product, partial [Prorocentrum cordatum]